MALCQHCKLNMHDWNVQRPTKNADGSENQVRVCKHRAEGCTARQTRHKKNGQGWPNWPPG